MHRKKFSQLRARVLGDPVGDPIASMTDLEREIGYSLPADYRSMVMEFAGPIVFDEPNAFRPDEPTPKDREDGTQTIDVLYGLGASTNGLQDNFRVFSDRIPKGTIPIGTVPGGDQLCLCLTGPRPGSVYLWDHEDERELTGKDDIDYGNMHLVATDLKDFVERLEISEDELTEPEGIIESKSWLDF